MDIARIVGGARKGTSHDAIFEELGWESLQNRRLSNKDKQFYKIYNKSAPDYLYELLPDTVGEHSQRNLRNAKDLSTLKCRIETFRTSFIPISIKRHNARQKDKVNDGSNSVVNFVNRKLYELGSRATAIKHAQLRMKCSLLSGHLYELHVLESPACQCGFNYEDTNHFFLHCPLFRVERIELLTHLSNLGITDVDTTLLLKGCSDCKSKDCNREIINFVHHLIECTNRL